MNHRVNLGWDVNSAHVSIVIYLRLQGTSVQSFISSFFHILYALLTDHFEHIFFFKWKQQKKRASDMISSNL